MQRFRFVLGFLVAVLAVAADLPPNAPSVETKLRKLEIRRIRAQLRRNAIGLCSSLKRSARGFCSVHRFGEMLQLAFNTNQLRILGPQWMAGDDFYLLYFAYDVEGRCPTIVRSLAREILTEKLSLTVRRELRESPVLVMRSRAGKVEAAVSNGESCSVESPYVDYYAAPAEAAGLPWSSPAIMETQSRSGYSIAPPFEGPSHSPAEIFRSCTLTELARLLERRLRIEVLDETGGSSRHDFALNSSTLIPDGVAPEQAAKELSEQLGIDARVEKRPLEHVLVDAPLPPKRITYQADGPVPPAPCPTP